MKMYKDGAAVNVDKEQQAKMKAAGWKKKKPKDFEGEPDSETEQSEVVFVCVECGAEYKTKPEICTNILEQGDEDNSPTVCNSETFSVSDD